LPELPGCIATGATVEEVKKNMQEAIEMHVKGLKEGNLPIPESRSLVEYVAV
jgi:predicted RNase H-like HicB family nuclease